MPTHRAWQFDPFAPTAPALLAWPAWLAFAALVLAVGLVELALDIPARIVTRARWTVGGLLCDAGCKALPPMATPQRLASSPFVWARGALRGDVAPESLPGDGALWRAVVAPDGTYAVLSDRTPGPRIGRWDELGGWLELSDPPAWVDFDAALEMARAWNDGRRGS